VNAILLAGLVLFLDICFNDRRLINIITKNSFHMNLFFINGTHAVEILNNLQLKLNG
jgi:hypothetical protein